MDEHYGVSQVKDGKRTMMFASILIAAGIIMTVSVLIVGCSSDPSGPPPSSNRLTLPFPWLKVTAPTHGQFYATAQSVGAQPARYTSGGIIYASTSQTQSTSGGTMVASNLGIPYGSHGEYWSIGLPTFGAISAWGLTGNPSAGIPAFTDSMYVPAEIHMTTPATPGITAISKSSSLPVHWNLDANNDSIIVGFNYDYVISQFADSTMPSADYSAYWIVPDNGSFTIPASAFSSVPLGGYVRVLVGRGIGRLVGPSTHRFHVYAATVSDGIFKMIP